jgi:hypothetical protein
MNIETANLDTEQRFSVEKLRRDIRDAAVELGDDEARFLVDAYYQMQSSRIVADNQVRALGESKEPHAILAWLGEQDRTLENQIKGALERYAKAHAAGTWAFSVVGIGPVITAGLFAHINIKMAPTVGHIWRFAGLDPTVRWIGAVEAKRIIDDLEIKKFGIDELKLVADAIGYGMDQFQRAVDQFSTDRKTGEPKRVTKDLLKRAISRRPWNAGLKTLCWKIGESFVKVSNNPNAFYGKVYKDRKELETARNAMGAFADQAAAILVKKKIGKTTEAYKSYVVGQLPPAHIHARAKRYAVKLFLAHLHEVWFTEVFGVPPPKPYPIRELGHTHYIPPPR